MSLTIYNKIKPNHTLIRYLTYPLMKKADFHGAGNEIRTRDSKLGKLVLYQLSYARLPDNVSYDKIKLLSIYL